MKRKVTAAFVLLVFMVTGLMAQEEKSKIIEQENNDIQVFEYQKGNKRIEKKDNPNVASNGDLQFGQKRIPLGGSVRDIRVADFNGDNFPDIATLDYANEEIKVFFGDKKQLYSKKVVIKNLNLGASFIGIADFNSDGLPDIAVADARSENYSLIFLNAGSGKFRPGKVVKTDFDSSCTLQCGSIEDVNGDGKPDIIALMENADDSKQTHGVVLINSSKGSKVKFEPYRVFEGAYDWIIPGDFNRDGFCDLYAVDEKDTSTTVFTYFQGIGDGSFSEEYSKPMRNTGAEGQAFDINGDGKLDVVVDGKKSGPSLIAKGYKTAKIRGTRTIKKSGSMEHGISYADLDGDGEKDLVAPEVDGISFYQGSGKGKFKVPSSLCKDLNFYSLSKSGKAANVVDINRDKKNDVIGLQRFPYDHSSLILMQNGGKKGKLQISNGRITKAFYIGTGPYIQVEGSFDYSGSNIDLVYNKDGSTARQSAHMNIMVYLDLWIFGGETFDVTATGTFLNKPGSKKGTIDFSFVFKSNVWVTGFTPKVTADTITLIDNNLISSNTILK